MSKPQSPAPDSRLSAYAYETSAPEPTTPNILTQLRSLRENGLDNLRFQVQRLTDRLSPVFTFTGATAQSSPAVDPSGLSETQRYIVDIRTEVDAITATVREIHRVLDLP